MSARRDEHALREQEHEQTGTASRINSARAGYLPISLEHTPLTALEGIGVYIRVRPETQSLGTGPSQDGFRLYCAETLRFTDEHRHRLLEHGVKFAYIRMVDQSRFRRQIAANLEDVVRTAPVAEASSVIYETSVELVNELLEDPDTLANNPKLGQLSKGITTLVLNNPSAFSHLFAASHHDFYTATHMVNVGTWMVPLALALGIEDEKELNLICQAGLMHDMGKIGIPESILNKSGKLSDEEWQTIRAHPQHGYDYLKKFGDIDERLMRVALEHHERLDGTGYPRGLKGDEIHPWSLICGVVDSFDAMTAFRPFKSKTMSVAEAMGIIVKESGSKYDPKVIEAWTRLVAPQGGLETIDTLPAAQPSRDDTRTSARTTFNCPARTHLLRYEGGRATEMPGVFVTAHNISRSGMGLLSQQPFEPGQTVRVYVQARGWHNRGLEGEVVRCRTYNDTWHEIGIRFTVISTSAAA
mgnify:CR=1 FL=1|jgi:HD-GYP domain-containing protein (c-di-GMP phosphodiesterase class II)